MEQILDQVKNISEYITEIFSKSRKFEVLGPADAPIPKIKNEWRINSIIKIDKKYPFEFQKFISTKLGTDYFNKSYKGVRIKLDVDPCNML